MKTLPPRQTGSVLHAAAETATSTDNSFNFTDCNMKNGVQQTIYWIKKGLIIT